MRRGFALAGRRGELAALLEGLGDLPAVVLVQGEAGVGKSRLVQEAAAVLAERGVRTLSGFCHPLREPLPLGPVLDALRDTTDWLTDPRVLNPQTGALAPLLPGLAERLPPAPDRPEDHRAAQFQLVGAVRALLEAVAPVVLMVEDVHWVDESTRELLLLLARDLPERLGLILTYRGEDLPPGTPLLGVPYRRPVGTHGTEISLAPLTEPDVHDLAAAALGARATPALGRMLYERSAGLPLVAEQDLLILRDHQQPGSRSLSHGPGSHGLADLSVLARADVPRELREALMVRVEALSPSAKAIVQAAAVLAVPADQHLLGRVAGLEAKEGTGALVETLQASVLRETATGRYGFRHALAQQAVYRDILGPHRQELHQAAVDALGALADPPLVQIAYHTRALGDEVAWLRQAEAAADQAIAFGDNGTAASLIHDILNQPDLESAQRARAALALAGLALESVEQSTSVAAMRRILRDTRLDPATRGEIRLGLGLLLVNQACDKGGFRELELAVGELSTRPDLAARAMIVLAMDEQTHTPEEAESWMSRAETAVRDSSNEAMQVAVRGARLTKMARDGDPAVWDMVDRVPRHSDDPEVRLHNLRAVKNAGSGAIELGHDERARALLTECQDIARSIGHLLMECYCRADLLHLTWLGGHWAGVEEEYKALTSQFPDVLPPAGEARLASGVLAGARGQWSLALECFAQAARLGETDGEVTWALRAAAGAARVHLARGETEAAWSTAAAALKTPRDVTIPRSADLLPVAVRAALACGHRKEAEELVESTERSMAGKDSPALRAELHLAKGFLREADGELAEAAEQCDLARLLYRAIGRPYHETQALEHLARARGDSAPHEAADLFTEAAAEYAGLGASADAARCRQALRSLGLARPSPRGRRGYGSELSPREHEVAALLAHGASNHDIAAALALSPRTVEHHVARTLKKLGTTRDKLTGSKADR